MEEKVGAPTSKNTDPHRKANQEVQMSATRADFDGGKREKIRGKRSSWVFRSREKKWRKVGGESAPKRVINKRRIDKDELD